MSWVGLFRRPRVDGLPNWIANLATFFLFISSCFIFLGFIDNHFNSPAWCVTSIRPFICNGTSLRYLTLKRLGFRQGGGIAYANLFRQTSEPKKHEVHFQFINSVCYPFLDFGKLFNVSCYPFLIFGQPFEGLCHPVLDFGKPFKFLAIRFKRLWKLLKRLS